MKTKICKHCKNPFEPKSSLYNCCSPVCYDKYKIVKEKEKKILKRDAKKISVSVLGKKLDKVFSEYIRKRDAFASSINGDMIVCITCGEIKNYSQFDCGHFVGRANRTTRWEEKNCNAQCKVCNNWGGGRQYEHGKAIDRKYGEGTADILIKLGHEPFKVKSERLQERIKYFQEKLGTLNLKE